MTPKEWCKAGVIIDEVLDELERATTLNGPLANSHTAYAVILEELDEYKAWVWTREKLRNKDCMRKELIQVAAMAIRAIIDTLPETIDGHNTGTAAV